MDRDHSTLWLPKSYQDLKMLPHTQIVYKQEFGTHTIVQIAPKVIIKYGGVFSEEIICTRFARSKTSVSVPRIIHHPPFPAPRINHHPPFTPLSSTGACYICMEKAPGVSLDKVIDTLTAEQLSHIDCGATQPHCLPAEVHFGSAALCQVTETENARVRFWETLSQ